MSEYILRKLCNYTFRNWQVDICLIGNLAIPNLCFRCDLRASFLVCNDRSSLPYSTSLGCRRQQSLACHAWNHGKSQKSSPLSQQCRFHCHMWSAGESHYCVNSKVFMKFGTHTNEESMKINKNDSHYPTLLAFLPNILRSHGFHFEKPTVPNNPMFPISPAQPWWCQYMTISTSLAIFVLTGSPRKGLVLRNLDVYLKVRRKKIYKQSSDRYK